MKVSTVVGATDQQEVPGKYPQHLQLNKTDMLNDPATGKSAFSVDASVERTTAKGQAR